MGSGKNYNIAVLPGDGIGPEVMDEALKVLDAAAAKFGFTLNYKNGLIGGAAIDATGTPLPDETKELCSNSDAVLLGSVGGPKWDTLPPEQRPELGGLLAIRKHLGLFANLRPVKSWPGLEQFCPLAERTVKKGFDILTVRELSSGIYFGQPKERNETQGLDTMIYKKDEVERIAKVAFAAAKNRGKKLTSIDKANVLYSSMTWRETVEGMREDYSDIELNHLYVDNAAMQFILNPSQFDVIVAGNLFGDILSDEAAALAGSLGMLPSASLGEGTGLYEPAGGSAPDIAGKGIANPIAQILSGAMMLEHSLGELEASKAITEAVNAAMASGLRTGDIAGDVTPCSTKEMGAAILANI